jgi:hypothetical protein
MRIVRITKDTNVAALRTQSAKTSPGVLEQLNPHLDLNRLTPGAVLVLPDEEDTGGKGGKGAKRAVVTTTIGAEAMQSFIGFAKEAIEASSQRVQAAAERAKAEESAIAAATKSRAVNAAAEKDPELKKMLDRTVQQAKVDTQAAADGVKTFAALGSAAQQELEALAKRLG